MAVDFFLALVEISRLERLGDFFSIMSIAVRREIEQDDLNHVLDDSCLYIEPLAHAAFNPDLNLLLSSLTIHSDGRRDFSSWLDQINKQPDRSSIDAVLNLPSSDADFKNQVNLILHELSSISASCSDMVVYGVTADAPAWADCKGIHHLIQGNADSIAHQAMQMFRMRVLAMSPFMFACCDRGEIPDFFGTPENPSILAEGWWVEGEKRFEPKTAKDANLIRNACAMMAVPARLLPNGARWLGNALIQRGGGQPSQTAAQDPCPLVHVMNGSGLLIEEMPPASERVSIQVACKLDPDWQRLHWESEREAG